MPSFPSLDPATGKLRARHVPDLPKAQVGLDQVDNTSDAAKPVSVAQQAALNAKVSGVNVSAVHGITRSAYAALGTKPATTLYIFID